MEDKQDKRPDLQQQDSSVHKPENEDGTAKGGKTRVTETVKQKKPYVTHVLCQPRSVAEGSAL